MGNDTILTKSLTSSKHHKSDSPKKHRKNASMMPTKESKDIDKILSESDEYISSKKQKDSKKLDNDKKIAITSSDDELFQHQKPSSKEQADFDDLFERDERLSGSESESEKKKLFDDFEHPEMLPFVPQRRAAKKASAQLSEHNLWRKTQQEAYLAELAQI